MILALDIGGTKLSAAWLEGQHCIDRKQVAMRHDETGFITALREITQSDYPVERVAVAATGYLREGCVWSVNQNTIPFWKGFPLRSVLEQQFNCPVVMLNDAQAAAWGEFLPRRKQLSNLLFITLSTGVGGGLIYDGKLRIGPHGLSGHIGHATVNIAPMDPCAGSCGCGRIGCLEHVASGTALARQATASFGRPLDSRQLFELADTNPQADAIVNNAAVAVAQAIADTLMVVDIEEVVIGGSVGLADGMLEQVQKALQEFPELFKLPVTPALGGSDAGLLGVADWAQHQ
ncbi:N-acetylmannosamine kinase [Buttiauxella sp. A2-C2_NF]|uniref:N-acetylmannosamine kinase n=1 Tax=Buttiauxella ferragutiae TaxID=82989 RepID=UPI001E621660|nr:N-acetylmannosamine kinase [Buttiauxella ferragutiae]MCE0827153.1 N-acetylmannosamine kinase [Buttiauxella ferragutiae]